MKILGFEGPNFDASQSELPLASISKEWLEHGGVVRSMWQRSWIVSYPHGDCVKSAEESEQMTDLQILVILWVFMGHQSRQTPCPWRGRSLAVNGSGNIRRDLLTVDSKQALEGTWSATREGPVQ